MPVVACTAWQMVFDYRAVDAAKRVLVLGGAGNVGAYVVQLARRAAGEVVTTASANDAEYVRELGAHFVVDARKGRFEDAVGEVDVVLDTIGANRRSARSRS